MNELNYCYECGRRINPKHDVCWYCGTPPHKEIRPARTCPYCANPIKDAAIKCHHCGEFLNEEKKADIAYGSAHEVSVDVPIEAPAGHPPPSGQARLDAAQARRLDAPPRRGLPAPVAPIPIDAELTFDDDDPIPSISEMNPEESGIYDDLSDPNDSSIIDAEFGTDSPPQSDMSPAVVENRELQHRPSSTELAVRGADVPARRRPGLPVPTGLFGKLLKPRPKVELDDSIEIDTEHPDDRYKICTHCESEIMAEDNYCYHCGFQFGTFSFESEAAGGKSNLFIYVLYVICCGLIFGHELVADAIGQSDLGMPLMIGGAIGAPLLSFWALARKPGFVSRLLALCLFLLSLGLIFYNVTA